MRFERPTEAGLQRIACRRTERSRGDPEPIKRYHGPSVSVETIGVTRPASSELRGLIPPTYSASPSSGSTFRKLTPMMQSDRLRAEDQIHILGPVIQHRLQIVQQILGSCRPK
jgi:hypothetical protein